MVQLLERHAPLALAAETGHSRSATGAYGGWRTHVRALAIAAGAADSDALVDILLAPLAPDVYVHQRYERGLSPARIAAALRTLAHSTVPD